MRFEQVCFHYADDPNSAALMHFSATLPAQAMTALVGPSGSGKTTVARLLLRHADPQAGSITIGGIDIRRMSPEVLNALVSVVFQDVHLFDDTVLANIRMGRPDADDAQVRAAAAAAQCLDFIERLPQGWNTRLGEIGDRLSGGERQRISIARALLKDAPIVVLDEPTAALDTESELAGATGHRYPGARQDGDRDRAPSVHDRRRRPHPGGGGWPAGGAGPA
ncbi:ATP-binding cassette domain-containing protein [Xanthomonas hortorum pv. pelargonii]|nr:ATP-binding cassette domain-containing protein [Xanthomonas hortorum pv. pelargonii]